jgi:hypothetical protein
MDYAIGLLHTVLNDPHFVGYYKFVLLTIVPVGRIFMRAGFRPFWALFLAVPDIGLVLCTVFLALIKWPSRQPKGA